MFIDWLVGHLLGLILTVISALAPIGHLDLPPLSPWFSMLMTVDQILPVSEVIEFARYGITSFAVIYGFRFFMWVLSQTPILGRGAGG